MLIDGAPKKFACTLSQGNKDTRIEYDSGSFSFRDRWCVVVWFAGVRVCVKDNSFFWGAAQDASPSARVKPTRPSSTPNTAHTHSLTHTHTPYNNPGKTQTNK